MTIDELLQADINLASPPVLYTRLKKAFYDPSKNQKDIEKIIESDPGFAMRLLRLVNSAYFGLPRKVTSLAHALSLIGTETLEQLVVETVVVDKFSRLDSELATMNDFWAYSVRCGLLARGLADVWPGYRESRETLFLCGLLHDIGRLVFYQTIPEKMARIGRMVGEHWPTETRLEREFLGFDHFQLGARLCRSWQLPDVLIDTIAAHEQADYQGGHRVSAEIIRLAYMLSRMQLPETDLLAAQGIDDEQLAEVVNRSHEQFEEVFKLFFPEKRLQ